MRLRREGTFSDSLVCGLTVFILHLPIHSTLFSVSVNPTVIFRGPELGRVYRRGLSGSFSPGYVPDDGARAHVQDKGERYAQYRDDQHGFLKTNGAERFGDRQGAMERGGAMRENIAQFPGKERSEGRTAHVHGHEIDGHRGSALI